MLPNRRPAIALMRDGDDVAMEFKASKKTKQGLSMKDPAGVNPIASYLKTNMSRGNAFSGIDGGYQPTAP